VLLVNRDYGLQHLFDRKFFNCSSVILFMRASNLEEIRGILGNLRVHHLVHLLVITSIICFIVSCRCVTWKYLSMSSFDAGASAAACCAVPSSGNAKHSVLTSINASWYASSEFHTA